MEIVSRLQVETGAQQEPQEDTATAKTESGERTAQMTGSNPNGAPETVAQ